VRGITESERSLLTHISRWGSDGYPVHRLGKRWSWGTDAVPGPPTVFRTKREAVESFERFHDILLDALAGRL
jgi:hypothetical protein